jgi:hypothetical protein
MPYQKSALISLASPKKFNSENRLQTYQTPCKPSLLKKHEMECDPIGFNCDYVLVYVMFPIYFARHFTLLSLCKMINAGLSKVYIIHIMGLSRQQTHKTLPYRSTHRCRRRRRFLCTFLLLLHFLLFYHCWLHHLRRRRLHHHHHRHLLLLPLRPPQQPPQ